MSTKAGLRRNMLDRLSGLSSEARCEVGRIISSRLIELDQISLAPTIFAYNPLPTEPDLSAALELWVSQKRLALPKIIGPDLRFFLVRDLTGLTPGSMGIFEPADSCPIVEPASLDVAIVPGLAFTAAGDRLGRGRGYYDRWLSKSMNNNIIIAACYSWQLLPSLPIDSLDYPVDFIVTETGVIKTATGQTNPQS